MENLRELQAQAHSLERAGKHAAALELYGRMVEEPAGERSGAIWARMAGLQSALGREEDAADSYAAAAERYGAAGLANLALSFCQRSLRADDSRPEMLLRFGQLSARHGYPRDARHGYAEYADRTVAAGDTEAAVAALREYLATYPSDAAVRRRLTELTGEPEPEPASETVHPTQPQPQSGAATLPGLVTTAHEAAGANAPPEETAAEAASPQVAPLEGLEPTHTGDAYAAPEPSRDTADERGHDSWGAPPPRDDYSAPAGGEAVEEEGETGEPLPLLGVADEGPAPDAEGEADSGEPLPLMDLGQESGTVAATPAGGRDPLSQARGRVRAEPDSLSARRELASLLREQGDPGLEPALEDADQYFADRGRAAEALEFTEQLARLRSDDTALQQRWVERALRAGNRPALVAAYLALAGRFEADLDTARAQEALGRVLELDPANEEARSALASVTAAAAPPRDYVDLGELILAGAPEEATRFQVAIGEPTGDEESDFAEILALFRRKVSESLDPKDAASHYDLGLAFKEMGLLDDAIVHLQSGLRGGANPLATLEVLGECFVMKGQVSLAARVFDRATRLDGVADTDLVGVLYGLARCQEQLGQMEEARATLERVVAVDLSFRDAAGRLQLLQSR